MPLFILNAFRAETVGTDLPRYAQHVLDGGWFNYNYGGLPFEFFSESLYFICYKTGGFHLFLFLTSLLEYLFLVIAMKEFSKKNINISFLFVLMFSYVVLRSVSMVRNGIALSASLCAYSQFFSREENSTLKYWIYSFVAIGFHSSAILNIPIYFICRPNGLKEKGFGYNLSFRIISILLLGVLLFYVGQSGFLELFFRLTGDSYQDSHFEEGGSWGVGNLLSRLPFLAFVLYSIPLMKKEKVEYMPYILLLLFDIIVSQTKYISTDFERLTIYTGLSRVILWGILCKIYTIKHGALARIVFVLVGLYFFTYYMHKYAILSADGVGNGLMPYHMWISLF